MIIKNYGSVCSGGRYENLAEHYTDKKLPGVGISIGLTRFFYQMKKENILEDTKKSISKVLIAPMSDAEIEYAQEVGAALREQNINTDIFLEDKKIKAKFKYADKLNIPYVVVIRRRRSKKQKYNTQKHDNRRARNFKFK